jgi:cell division protein FtsX
VFGERTPTEEDPDMTTSEPVGGRDAAGGRPPPARGLGGALLISVGLLALLVLTVVATPAVLERFRSSEADVAIYLCDGQECPPITDEDRDALGRLLADDPDIHEVVFETPSEAYERAAEMFEDEPQLVATFDDVDFVASYRIYLVPGTEAERLVSRYGTHPGVEVVTVRRDLDRPDAG